jgi:hypothetical protein
MKNLQKSMQLFQAEVDADVQRKQQNKGKASAFLFSHRNKAMQSKLQARALDELPRKQVRDEDHCRLESLIDYTRSFKTSRDVPSVGMRYCALQYSWSLSRF